jgi:hypothetical protein
MRWILNIVPHLIFEPNTRNSGFFFKTHFRCVHPLISEIKYVKRETRKIKSWFQIPRFWRYEMSCRQSGLILGWRKKEKKNTNQKLFIIHYAVQRFFWKVSTLLRFKERTSLYLKTFYLIVDLMKAHCS